MELKLTSSEVKALRKIGARIQGHFGGRARTQKKIKAVRLNGKAHKASEMAA